MARIRRRRRHRRPSRRRPSRARLGRSAISKSPYPWKLSIAHDTALITSATNAQQMVGLTCVGAIQRLTGDSTVTNLSQFKTLAEEALLITPYNGVYTTQSEIGTVASPSPAALQHVRQYFKSQKCRVSFTNTSIGAAWVELYVLYPRYDIPLTSTVPIDAMVTTGASYSSFVATGTNAADNVALSSQTPGVTPYDNPRVTKSFIIRRLGIKHLQPGAQAMTQLRTGPYTYMPMDTQYGDTNFAYKRGLTKFLLMRSWGQTTDGTGGPCLAPTSISITMIFRTKWKRVDDPLYGMKVAGCDSNVQTSHSAPVLVVQANPAAGAGPLAGTAATTV